jgi:DNA-binding NtrC family response regulator
LDEERITPPAEEPSGLSTVFLGTRATARRLRKASLRVVEGIEVGKVFEIDRPRMAGGRHRHNEFQLDDASVSGTHFELVADESGYLLRDLGSRNGTFVGSLRIREVYLAPGARFRAGKTLLEFAPTDLLVDIPISARDRFGMAIGSSTRMREIFAHLERVAPTDLNVLITGETGTGKELVARGLHAASLRKNGPFVVLDCGSIPRDLIEATLFGHEKGAFTGASERQPGCFEDANGGTIFLDEIGELDVALQPRLLRVLEQREVKRIGGHKPIAVDVRVIAATNRDLRADINAGKFREDLFFRLSVTQCELPPLRDRREDIPRIAQDILARASVRMGRSLTLGEDVLSALTAHSWPGNVRELRNVVERAAALADGPEIVRADVVFHRGLRGRATSERLRQTLPPEGRTPAEVPGLTAGLTFQEAKSEFMDWFGRTYLGNLLARNHFNITRSAAEAGVTRFYLRQLMKRFGLDGED